MTVSSGTVVVNQETIAYRRTAGSGRSVVFFHGIMDSARAFDHLGQALRRPTIAVDLPGFGASSLFNSRDLGFWADSYQQALLALQVAEGDFIGHSLGGALALEIANRNSRLVSTLGLVAPAGFCSLPLSRILSQPLVEGVLQHTAPRAMGFDPLVDLLYRELFSHHQKLNPELKIRLKAERQTMIPGIKQGMKVLADLSRQPFTASSYRWPLYALWGDHDHLVPQEKSWSQMKKILPQAQLTIFPQTGHHPQEERPELFLDWLHSWITEPALDAGGQ